MYRWGDLYTVDHGRSSLSKDYIVNATSVSVVDLRENVPVTVQVSISSAAIEEFIILVTFLCTVDKPEEVVRAGLRDMSDSLGQYLGQHQRLFSLGEEYQPYQINTVRKNVWAEIKAYFTLRPPQSRGMEIKLGNIQVLTPAELPKFSKTRQPTQDSRRPVEELSAGVFGTTTGSNGRRMDVEVNTLSSDDSRLDPPSGLEATGHVFISYVREDSLMVDRLQQILRAAGVRVWRDTANLWPGEDWRDNIRRAITEDALVFLACFSSRSLARRKTYQNEELNLAISEMRLRPPGRPWLIPVRFDDCDIPDFDIGRGRSLSSILYADLIGDRFEDGAARLTAAVLRILT